MIPLFFDRELDLTSQSSAEKIVLYVNLHYSARRSFQSSETPLETYGSATVSANEGASSILIFPPAVRADIKLVKQNPG